MTAVQPFGTVVLSVVSSHELGSGDIAFLAFSSDTPTQLTQWDWCWCLGQEDELKSRSAPRRRSSARAWREAYQARAACGLRRLAADQRQPALREGMDQAAGHQGHGDLGAV